MRAGWRILLLAAMALATLSILFSVLLYSKAESESVKRIDQNCTLFEYDHKSDVNAYQLSLDRYRDTIKFLDKYKNEPSQRVLITAVKEGLPKQRVDLAKDRKRALHDTAPSYCDEPNVGLPEPDPRIPK